LQAQRFTPWTQPVRRIAPAIVAAGVAVAGSVLSSAMAPDAQGYPEAKVLPKTVSGSTLQDFDVLYDMSAIKNMYDFADNLSAIADEDRKFFTDVYKPFQESMAAINQNILPAVEKTSGEALEQITKSLVSGEQMTEIMKLKANQGLDPETMGALGNFRDQLANLPTESERIGQALVNVESAFGEAGKALSRDFQSRGQTVSQASQRDLLMEKAKAKAGAAGLASEASRKERLAAAEAGAGLEMQRETIEQGFRTGAATTAAQFGGLAQSAPGAAKSGLMQIDPITGLEQSQLAGGMLGTLSQQQFGTRSRADEISHTQKGIKEAQVSSGAGSGSTSAGGVSTTGEPARDAQGNLVTAGGFSPVSGGKFDKTPGVARTATTIGVGKTIGFHNERFHVQDDGDIINLQTGQFLDSSLSGDSASKYDTKKFIKMLQSKYESTRGSSGITTELKNSITDRSFDRKGKRRSGDGEGGSSGGLSGGATGVGAAGSAPGMAG